MSCLRPNALPALQYSDNDESCVVGKRRSRSDIGGRWGRVPKEHTLHNCKYGYFGIQNNTVLSE